MEDKDIIDLDSQINEANNNDNGVYMRVKPKLPNATAALVLGIISLVTMCFYGIPGLITGIIGFVLAKKDRAMYLSNPSKWDEGSYKNSNAGYICSIIGMSISALFLLFLIFYLIFVVSVVSSVAGNEAWLDAIENSNRYDSY